MSSKCIIEEVFNLKVPCCKATERLGRKGVRGDKIDEEICPWHISSKQHFNCFWVYLLDVNNRKEHQLTEIAALLGTSVNNIKLVQLGALSKLREHLNHLKISHS